MKSIVRFATLALLLLIVSAGVRAQEHSSGGLAERQRTSTVLGGTGLFNTFSTRTLYRGEFNFAVFWNRFNRDPGDLIVDQAPFNFTVGITNRWEAWVDWVTWQRVRSDNPFLLSGYQYNAVRLFGEPVDILGPPVGGTRRAAAFFPGTLADFGGILPRLGLFGTPSHLNGASAVSPGGPNGPAVVGLGPAIVSTLPSFYNDLPLIGVIDFLGFDSLGRPVLGPERSGNGSGDVYTGTKVTLVDPNKHWFSAALGGYVKIPVSDEQQARARGRTNGEFEFGPMLILGQETYNKRFRLYENIGYIHSTDIERGGVKALDLRDKLLLNLGMGIAPERHTELVAELLHTRFLGGGTPSVLRNDPFELNAGLRFFFRQGAISFGGAYRRFLNSEGSISVEALDCARDFSAAVQPFGPPPPPPCVPRSIRFSDGDNNGFVSYFSVGARKECPLPPVPQCALQSSASVVTRGDRLVLTALPSTHGYAESNVTYQYRWEVKDVQGRPVTVSGSGASVQVPTARLACGTYSAMVTVSVTVASGDRPEGCVTMGQTNCDAKFEIVEPPCPNVTCSIIASATTVTEGDRVALRCATTGEGNLTLSWTTTGGRLSSTTGTEVTLSTSGISGPVTVRCNVSTDRLRCDQPCPGTSCSTSIAVQAIPPTPGRRSGVIRPCGPLFFPPVSARVNNEHKACLDQVALALQGDPRTSLVVDGHRDSAERVGVSLTRANNSRDYLINEKGVDAARITVRNFGDTCPHESRDAKLNRRVELWLLPEGASISDANALKRCAPGSAPRVLTNEEPANVTEPRPPRRAPRRPKGAASTDQAEDTSSGAARPTPNYAGSGIVTRPRTVEPVAVNVPTVVARGPKASKPLQPATILRAVRTETVAGQYRIYIETDGLAEFRDFALTVPSRIVVDVFGVRNASRLSTIAVSAGLVQRVRVGVPEAGVVRVVLDLKSAISYQVARDGTSIVINVGSEAVASKFGVNRR